MILLKDAISKLSDEGLLIECVNIDPQAIVAHVSHYSKDIKEDTLFICKGINFKEDYLKEALMKGAFCYIAEEQYPFAQDIPCIVVNDIRKALAVIAGWYYDYKKDSPEICAVTGTKGKSTAVHFLANILQEDGRKVAYATTVDIFDGVEKYESTLTTPESLDCHRYIHSARESGCDDFVMEVSSQAYKMSRIYGINFKYGIFINISNDHISPNEHSDFEDYFKCKLEIVKKYENAVINLDGSHTKRVVETAKNAKRILTYSVNDPKADIYAKNIVRQGFTTSFEIVTPSYEIAAVVMIPGLFNVSNALSAVGIAYLKGIDPEKIVSGIKKTRVPGRMSIYEKDGHTVIVDYAHNKDSIKIALKAIKEYYPDKNIRVAFGCPGGKALQRRYDMALETAKYAERIYVTSEDPSFEDPMVIASEVQKYLNELDCDNDIIIDRHEAIKQAISELGKDDLLLIAGKGSEHYQVVHGVAVPYEGDTELADRYINELK